MGSDDEHFLVRFGCGDGCFYSFVQCLNTTVKSQSFDYRLRSTNGRYQTSFEAPVESVCRPMNDLVQEKAGFWIPAVAAKRLASEVDEHAGTFSLSLHVQIAPRGSLP